MASCIIPAMVNLPFQMEHIFLPIGLPMRSLLVQFPMECLSFTNAITRHAPTRNISMPERARTIAETAGRAAVLAPRLDTQAKNLLLNFWQKSVSGGRNTIPLNLLRIMLLPFSSLENAGQFWQEGLAWRDRWSRPSENGKCGNTSPSNPLILPQISTYLLRKSMYPTIKINAA